MSDLGQPARESASIEVRCLSCGRTGVFDHEDSRIAGAPLVRLTRRFVCSACGSRAVKATTLGTPRDLARRLRTRLREG